MRAMNAIISQSRENQRYLAQKPVALIERILIANSSEGDIVLDPFYGSGTTCVAAEKLNRQWIGIDISAESHPTLKKRLINECAESGIDWGREVVFRTDVPKRINL